VDEHAPVELVIERTEVRQPERPDHQAGRRGAACRQRNAVLRAELTDVMREEQQIG
jgi:hypothetical protein